MATVLVTCTIVLVIILATLVVGITTALVASRYCKCKSRLVFVEEAPAWEKAVVVQPPPIPPPPPPPCICTTVVCPSPPFLPPAIPSVNTQKISRPSGPFHPWQRRYPPRTVQSTSQLPNLIRLPPRRLGRSSKQLSVPLPRAQPFKVFVELRLSKPRSALLPQKELKPGEPKPTKLAEGLKTPPLPFGRIMSSLPCKPQQQRHMFRPLGKLRGKPSSAPMFFLVVPRLVPEVKLRCQVHVMQRKIAHFGARQALGRLHVEPRGDFCIEEVQVRARQPRDSQKPESLRRPTANPAMRYTSTAGKLKEVLFRPSGPCPRSQHRDPSGQSKVELPNLIRLPARTGASFPPMLPRTLPDKQPGHEIEILMEVPSQIPMPRGASALPEVELKPHQPKPTQSAEGLRTTAVALNLIRYLRPYESHYQDSVPSDLIRALPNTEPPLSLMAPRLVHLVPIIAIHEPTNAIEVVVLIGEFNPCAAQPGRFYVEPHGSFTSYVQWRPRLPRPTAKPDTLCTPAVNLSVFLGATPTPPVRRDMSGYLTSTLGGPWWKKGPNPSKVEISASPECYYGDPFWMERVEVSVDTRSKSNIGPSQPGKRSRLQKSSSPKSRQPLKRGDNRLNSINAGWCKEGRKLMLLEISAPSDCHEAAFWMEPVEVPESPAHGANFPRAHPELTLGGNSRDPNASQTLSLWCKDRPQPLAIEISGAPECHHCHRAPFLTEKSNVEVWIDQEANASREQLKSRERSKSPGRSGQREPTPGPGHYNPEHPAIHGRIPGRVPGFPKIPRDPDIRL